MTSLQTLTLGVVQGLTEFLPVSSSGHLILVPVVTGWPDQGLAFDAAVHLGTSLALLCYFGRDLGRLLAGVMRNHAPDTRLAAALVLGTVPAGVAGLLLERIVEARLRSPVVVALSTIGWAIVLWWADRRAERSRVSTLSGVGILRSVVIGCAQAVALVPGTSRSGITISAGLVTGLDRPTAARFAFLLGLPLTLAAGLLKTAKLLHGGLPTEVVALALGLVASFAAGLLAVWFLVRFLQRQTLRVFVAYRLALGIFILWFVVLRAT